ncbi:MAG: YajG family lipoprotein [Syntrophorhabdaceae bacterium]|nr:YajG family lipoprotein [Syntrophorhabdaceae bacterium]
MYNVNLNYEPTKQATKPEINLSKVVFTVAEFNDLRNMENKSVVGKVIESKSKETPIISLEKKPSYAFASAFKDALFRSGLTVAGDIPSWDNKEGSIKKEWGRIIIGGNINELELVVKDGIATKSYEAKVNVRIMVGDVKKSEIFYIPTYESANTITDITFSEEKAQRNLNAVISTVIDRLIADKELWKKIGDNIKNDP